MNQSPATQETSLLMHLAPLRDPRLWLFPLLLSIALIAIASSNFLVFHVAAEFCSILVACSLFAFGWYTQPFSRNAFLFILSCGYFWIGATDMLHTLVYKGMDILITDDGNRSIQLWLVARYCEALLLLGAPLFLKRQCSNIWLPMVAFGSITALLTGLVFSDIFPTGFIAGSGLTPFKIYSEYLIIFILILALGHLYHHRREMSGQELPLIVASILFTIGAELAFTIYVSVYGLSNLVGHIFKIFSYWLIFSAVLRINLQQTYRKLVELNRQLADSQRELGKLSKVVEQSPVSVIMTDTNGVIQYANRHCQEVSGYRASELIGQRPSLLKSGHTSKQEYRELWQTITSGKVWRGVFCNRHRDGSTFWESATISPILDEHGKIINYAGIKDDITQSMELEADNQRQKEILETVIRAIPDGIVVSNQQREIVSVNPGLLEQFGYRSDELIGRSTSILYANDQEFKRQGQLRFNADAKQSNNAYLVDYRRQDGSQFPGETVGVRLNRPNGEVIGYLGMIRDVTARIEQEETERRHQLELQRERDRVQRYLDLSPVMFSLLDSSGKIRLINRKGCELLGYSENELVGCNWFDLLIPKEERAELKEMFDMIIQDVLPDTHQNAGSYHENRLLTKNGESRCFSFHNTRIQLDDGHLPGVLFAAEDITERNMTESALRHAQKMEAVGELTGGISHDFNNILGIIIGNLELAQRLEDRPQELAERLEQALRGARRGVDITRKLLNFSRNETISRQPTDLNQTLSALMELISKVVTPRVTIETRLESPIWLVNIDPGELEDCLINLMINARDAMPDGGHLIISTANQRQQNKHDQRLEEWVRLTIRDTGIGMSKRVLEKVFEPFFSTKKIDQGTGLGMSMVYGFVQRSHGEITIESTEGQGTTVHIDFPRVKVDSKISQPLSSDTKPDGSSKGSGTILVVDDEEVLVEIATANLQMAGYRVVTAFSADEALELIKANREIDLLFSDIVMPGQLNGKQLAIEAQQVLPGLPVILASGIQESLESENNKALQGIVQARLNKPYSASELLGAVRDAMEQTAKQGR